MPKGGDLHTHLGGAVYAERFIAWAAEQGLCVDLRNVVLPKPQCDGAGAVPVSDAMRDQNLYNRLVDALSMRAFLQLPPCPRATANSSRPSTNSERCPARISST